MILTVRARGDSCHISNRGLASSAGTGDDGRKEHSADADSGAGLDAPVVVLAHVRVIYGTGAAGEEQTIVLRKGRIESLSDAATANVPKGAQVLDLHGYSVIPGLVGMHDHLFYPAGNVVFGEMAFSFPRLYLAGGVTTIRTTGSLEPYTDLEIKKAVDAGKMPGPKMHVTGPIWKAQARGRSKCTNSQDPTTRPGQ